MAPSLSGKQTAICKLPHAYDWPVHDVGHEITGCFVWYVELKIALLMLFGFFSFNRGLTCHFNLWLSFTPIEVLVVLTTMPVKNNLLNYITGQAIQLATDRL